MTKTDHPLPEGTRVLLSAFDNGEEVIPPERATILAHDDVYFLLRSEHMYTVRVDEEHRDGPEDDGLRDVLEELIDRLLEEGE